MAGVGSLLLRTRFRSCEDDAVLVRRLAGASGLWRALDGGEVCVHGEVDPARLPADAERAILRCTLVMAGAAAGVVAGWHYVVETDVLPEMEDEFNAWYTEEHLPGLAAVPGTVRAWRYRRVGDGPRYTACYDLATHETFGSPPWLAVRATPWSDRVRPAFRRTRRTMYRRLGSGAG
ncbi:MAG: hypothetical protein JNM26_10270 [Ideonella sp.]|nr:hypothetical protein [Ideonella sp.]